MSILLGNFKMLFYPKWLKQRIINTYCSKVGHKLVHEDSDFAGPLFTWCSKCGSTDLLGEDGKGYHRFWLHSKKDKCL